MPGIMSDADIAQLGDSMEAGKLRNAFEAFIAHHAETEKKLAQARIDGRTLAAALRASSSKLTPEETTALERFEEEP